MKSIRQKLVVYTLALVGISLLASNIANTFLVTSNYQDEINQKNVETANYIAEQVSAFIEKGYAITELISLDNEVKEFVPEK